MLAVCTALTALCKLLSVELVDAVLSSVVELLKHPKELVRKKAIMALHRFEQLDPQHQGPLHNMDVYAHIRDSLRDKVCLSWPCQIDAVYVSCLRSVLISYRCQRCPNNFPLTLTQPCWQDVSVMSATLCAVHEVSSRDSQPFKHLVPSLISILKQVRSC